jgi:hypothetical protein
LTPVAAWRTGSESLASPGPLAVVLRRLLDPFQHSSFMGVVPFSSSMT